MIYGSVGYVVCVYFFFFKQKTAYEMRISDWSSDVCSSDLHPVPYVGSSDSTRAKEKPFQRLSSTAAAFETIFFGSKKQADRVLHGVHSMHTRVSGELDRDEGNYPKGTPYDALDQELRLWRMAMIADMSRAYSETMVRPLGE